MWQDKREGEVGSDTITSRGETDDCPVPRTSDGDEEMVFITFVQGNNTIKYLKIIYLHLIIESIVRSYSTGASRCGSEEDLFFLLFF